MENKENSNSAPVTPFNAEELAHFKGIILEKRKSAINDVDALRGQLKDANDQAGEDTAYGTHMADAGTDAMEREKLFLMIGRQQKFIGYLDRALDRIERGTYGICKVTGKAISKERLEAVPHTEICIKAKLRQKRGLG